MSDQNFVVAVLAPGHVGVAVRYDGGLTSTSSVLQ
jgi:hypothetical protein